MPVLSSGYVPGPGAYKLVANLVYYFTEILNESLRILWVEESCAWIVVFWNGVLAYRVDSRQRFISSWSWDFLACQHHEISFGALSHCISYVA